METNETQSPQDRQHWKHYTPSRAGRVMSGLVVIGVGVLLLSRQMGALIPAWIFTWPMILVAVGLYAGAKRSFQGLGWLIPIVIGAFFMLEDRIPGLNLKVYMWPIFFIFVGLCIMFKPRRPWGRRHCGENAWKDNCNTWKDRSCKPWDARTEPGKVTEEAFLDSVCIFGGVKKNVISKDFRGGDVVCIFGGAEINLTQTDIVGTQNIEVTSVFGGIKLIVPAHWKIQVETTAVFGGVEDQRSHLNINADPEKVLIIRGTTFFGGVSIHSY